MNNAEQPTVLAVLATVLLLMPPGGSGEARGQDAPIDTRDDFSDGNAMGWEIVDDSGNPSGWTVADGAVRQRYFVGNVRSAVEQGYHVGTYAYLPSASSASNYRVSVSMTPRAPSGEEIGVMFYYRDADNYYRFSTSFSDGFSRLEKKVGGRFATLAQNARGYPAGTRLAVVVDAADGIIQVSVDGEKLFSAYDRDLSGGAIALYTRDDSAFDDVSVEPVGREPAIALAEPADFSVLRDATFPVRATVLDKPTAAEVRFLLDGDSASCTPATESDPGHFTATCTAALAGEHELAAELLEPGRVIDSDVHAAVATQGNVYVTIGDSITWGDGDSYSADGTSRDGRRRSLRGFQANLADELNAATPVINVVFNEAVRGDTLQDVLTLRIESYLERHPDANYAIVALGTNNARPPNPLPSGLNCPDTVLDGKFKGYLKTLVEMLNATGITPIVVQVPPRFGEAFDTTPYRDPLRQRANAVTIHEYNQVIRGEDAHPLKGYIVGPDLFAYYLGDGRNRFHLFEDNLHPNALAHAILAAQLRNVITGDTALPPIVDELCIRYSAGAACEPPTLYKQDLLETGDRPYVDRDYVIVGDVPPALGGGRWIRTADADLGQGNDDHLSFAVPTAATVYVAVDAAATPPEWLAVNGFTLTDMELATNHPRAPRLHIHERRVPAGIVTLGGANAEVTGAGANYFVIVSMEASAEESR